MNSLATTSTLPLPLGSHAPRALAAPTRTALEGRPQTLDAPAARRALLRQPLLTLAVVWRIHWQALQLWLKRAVFHSRPQPPLQETTR